ncbi:MAG: 2-C-methyl-D-erythritol 4-phosphate cytidylyltransferase [Dehalococcoidia bacterium]|nr:2-C-methyl-D-erythritol 4-phosphate cytidylyltransferase [Dehalococcoidia bacterium]
MNESGDDVGAVIVAAGAGTRMGNIDKIFARLGDAPLLARVLNTFQDCRLIDKIVVVLSPGNLEQGRMLVEEYGWSKVITVCRGGLRRQDSVQEGLNRLSGCSWVVIHDGARPFVTVDLIEQGIAVARETGAAIAGVPVKDTVKIVSRRHMIQQTPARQSLWAAQTPQVFRYDLITEAYRHARADVTDDSSLLESRGQKVRVYMGSYENIKITTPEDLALAEVLLRSGDKRHSGSKS